MTKNKLSIKILSVGGRGANILERLDSFDKQDVSRIAVGINGKVFSRIKVKDKIELRKNENISTTNDNKNLFESIINEKQPEIEKSLKDADILFILGNLANDTSHYQIARISQIAKEKGILTFFLGSTPFPFEGDNKIKLSNENKVYLEEHVDAILMLESERIMTEKISAMEAMTKVDNTLGEIISSIIDLVNKFGVVNVDFADLKTTIQNAGEIFFNSVNGDKVEIDNLITNLFERNDLQNQNRDLDKILYVIYAGKDILMDEIDSIGRKLQEKFNREARIIFGVVNEEKMKNKLKIVMIGS
jgi:cell division protein FtsZ